MSEKPLGMTQVGRVAVPVSDRSSARTLMHFGAQPPGTDPHEECVGRLRRRVRGPDITRLPPSRLGAETARNQSTTSSSSRRSNQYRSDRTAPRERPTTADDPTVGLRATGATAQAP